MLEFSGSGGWVGERKERGKSGPRVPPTRPPSVVGPSSLSPHTPHSLTRSVHLATKSHYCSSSASSRIPIGTFHSECSGGYTDMACGSQTKSGTVKLPATSILDIVALSPPDACQRHRPSELLACPVPSIVPQFYSLVWYCGRWG